MKYQIKCNWCGKFTSVRSSGKFIFKPDSIEGPEESYWECKKCK